MAPVNAPVNNLGTKKGPPCQAAGQLEAGGWGLIARFTFTALSLLNIIVEDRIDGLWSAQP